ncbi:MAG: hypothetical protein ACXWW0_10810 [Bacteroidia bacterium]
MTAHSFGNDLHHFFIAIFFVSKVYEKSEVKGDLKHRSRHSNIHALSKNGLK